MARISQDMIIAIQILYFEKKLKVDEIIKLTSLSRGIVVYHTIYYQRAVDRLKAEIEIISPNNQELSDLIQSPVNYDTLRHLRKIYDSLH